MQVWLNHSVYIARDFAKEQYAGVYKSYYDFASRYYGIDNLLTGSEVNPATFKSFWYIVCPCIYFFPQGVILIVEAELHHNYLVLVLHPRN